MNEQLELMAADGHRFGAYAARPATAARAGIVVLQEIFGVNAHIRSICDRLAALGYLAVAPALYDRAERDAQLAYGAEGVARGRAIRQQVNDDVAMRDVAATVDAIGAELGPQGKIGVIGFCWGGTLAWLAAARLARVDAAVAFYGTGIAGYLAEAPRKPVLLHFGRQDTNIPQADVAKLRAAFPAVPVHEYDAGHGFNCDDRAAYEPASAKAAWDRTTAFFAEQLTRA
ncbi:dienelactone hydrolase family protein [Ramlibacter sp. G-1-2-2]|uniref:Dienelactone hydrolase family protein n=1 Tax=Ramlibacter agri TaxID=2728837 RepID=A0A848H8G9_9BURK|nr:dienelactone hydrolase family protein [Ramlibacter agri]NML47276.1 dienelactone hydrolase family protein [Ramlibacter agri]